MAALATSVAVPDDTQKSRCTILSPQFEPMGSHYPCRTAHLLRVDR